MPVKKNLSFHPSDDDYLIGVVQAQLLDDFFAPRGFYIVKPKIRPSEMIEVITQKPMQEFIPFGEMYACDISQNEALRDFFSHIVRTMTDNEFCRLMKIFEIAVGFNDALPEFTYLNDLEIKVQIRQRELQIRQEILQEKILICRLWILHEWTVDQIAVHLMLPRRKVETIISTFRKRHLSLRLASMIRKFDIQRCLNESMPILIRQFTMSYSEKSLQEIFDSLCQIPDFARLISFRRFEEYLKDDLGICFARLKTIKSNVDDPASKEMRRTLSLMVMKLMAEEHFVLFLDGSLI